jgi:glycosyltransferase involved in cell wall biosynthesis
MPDLIHAHFSIWSGVIAYQLFKIFKIPYIITEHSSSYGRGMVKNKYLSLLTNVLDNAQQIVCVSEGLANDISKYTSKNIVVIRN